MTVSAISRAQIGRARSIEMARRSFNAALRRRGRIIRQVNRALIAGNDQASMRELRSWAYPSQSYRRWHKTDIYRALHWLGAKRIGWGVYATYAQHDK
jgi:hypothetical protein